MTGVRLLREAKEELRAAVEFYESEQRGLGSALLQEIRRTLRLIGERPLASRIERGELRVRSVTGFLIASTNKQPRPKSSLLLSAIAAEDLDSGASANSRITSRCSGL